LLLAILAYWLDQKYPFPPALKNQHAAQWNRGAPVQEAFYES
jgi:hypothetical protein